MVKFDRTPVPVLVADFFDVVLDIAFKLSVVAIAIKYILSF